MLKLHPVYKRVDTCAAEFATETATSTPLTKNANPVLPTVKVMILGGGPNASVRASSLTIAAFMPHSPCRESGFETIMVNCNPETVSTDFDTSDRLYFEPLTLEDVLEIVRTENPWGVIVHYGGQTPLKLANALVENGVNIIGTSADSIDAAEDRERFQKVLNDGALRQPPNRIAHNEEEALVKAPKKSVIRWLSVLLTYSAAAPCRLFTLPKSCKNTCAKPYKFPKTARIARLLLEQRHRSGRGLRFQTAKTS